MFISDSHYAIGKSHLTCQDYALSGHHPVPYAILADGCSSSADSDVGARLLALAARDFLSDHFSRTVQAPHYRRLGLYAALKAQAAARAIGVAQPALDATLLAVFTAGEQLFVYAYGDGFIVSRDPRGHWRIVRIEFTHNAPFYPAYLAVPSRLVEYHALSRGEEKRVTDSGAEYQGRFDCRAKSILVFARQDIDLLAIASDGLDSFVDRHNRSQRPAEDLATEFLTLKNRSPGFVKRRMSRALRTLGAHQVLPADDLSIGALVRSEYNSWSSS